MLIAYRIQRCTEHDFSEIEVTAVVWFLCRLAARSALVTAVAMTVLCQFRSIDAWWSNFAVHSIREGWVVDFTPGFSSGAHLEIDEVDTYYKKVELLANLDRLITLVPGRKFVFIDHWMIWFPLLLLNVSLWWIDRRRKRMGIGDDS